MTADDVHEELTQFVCLHTPYSGPRAKRLATKLLPLLAQAFDDGFADALPDETSESEQPDNPYWVALEALEEASNG